MKTEAFGQFFPKHPPCFSPKLPAEFIPSRCQSTFWDGTYFFPLFFHAACYSQLIPDRPKLPEVSRFNELSLFTSSSYSKSTDSSFPSKSQPTVSTSWRSINCHGFEYSSGIGTFWIKKPTHWKEFDFSQSMLSSNATGFTFFIKMCFDNFLLLNVQLVFVFCNSIPKKD